MITLEALSHEVHNLAPLPAAASRLAALMAGGDTEFDEALAIIRYDQALTAGVLRYANSPIAGARYTTNNVRDENKKSNA